MPTSIILLISVLILVGVYPISVWVMRPIWSERRKAREKTAYKYFFMSLSLLGVGLSLALCVELFGTTETLSRMDVSASEAVRIAHNSDDAAIAALDDKDSVVVERRHKVFGCFTGKTYNVIVLPDDLSPCSD